MSPSPDSVAVAGAPLGWAGSLQYARVHLVQASKSRSAPTELNAFGSGLPHPCRGSGGSKPRTVDESTIHWPRPPLIDTYTATASRQVWSSSHCTTGPCCPEVVPVPTTNVVSASRRSAEIARAKRPVEGTCDDETVSESPRQPPVPAGVLPRTSAAVGLASALHRRAVGLPDSVEPNTTPSAVATCTVTGLPSCRFSAWLTVTVIGGAAWASLAGVAPPSTPIEARMISPVAATRFTMLPVGEVDELRVAIDESDLRGRADAAGSLSRVNAGQPRPRTAGEVRRKARAHRPDGPVPGREGGGRIVAAPASASQVVRDQGWYRRQVEPAGLLSLTVVSSGPKPKLVSVEAFEPSQSGLLKVLPSSVPKP